MPGQTRRFVQSDRMFLAAFVLCLSFLLQMHFIHLTNTFLGILYREFSNIHISNE